MAKVWLEYYVKQSERNKYHDAEDEGANVVAVFKRKRHRSDNGNFCSDTIADYVQRIRGEQITCCAYTEEIMAFIKRLWGIINNMAT